MAIEKAVSMTASPLPAGSDAESDGPASVAPGGRMGRLTAMAFIAALSGAMMPGPLLVATIQQSAARGLDAAFWLITGHALLEAVLLVLLMVGLRAVIARPRVRALIGLVGGTALIYMGADMALQAARMQLSLEAAGQAAAYSPVELIVLGAAVSLANPYFTGWWATIGAGQLSVMAPRTPGEFLGFYLGHEAGDFAWFLFVGFLVVTGRQWLTDGAWRAAILLCGLILVILGLWFLGRGLALCRLPKDP